jgi:hypothetical protein
VAGFFYSYLIDFIWLEVQLIKCCPESWKLQLNIVVLIPCTERKRSQPDPELMARTLVSGNPTDVATDWATRVKNATELAKPDQVYCGRAFKEARNAASLLQAPLYIVSAGLGLVEEDRNIPAYGLTVSTGKPDSISEKITDRDWLPSLWWKALGTQETIDTDISGLVSQSTPSLVLMALSESYAKLIHDDLAALDEASMQRFRIFGLGLANHLPEGLAPNIMPYDARFNGAHSPLRGTLSDFGSRAIHHYSQCFLGGIVDGANAASDRDALLLLMSGWSEPTIPRRERITDDHVIAFILENWATTGGRSGESLRFLRRSGLACEQGRFKKLFYRAKSVRDQDEVISK